MDVVLASVANKLLPDAVVLSLHGVGEPHSRVDDDERPYWLTSERFREVTTRCIEATRAHGLSLTLTFDDANLSDYAQVLPLLLELGLTGRFFVPLDRIGTPNYLERKHLLDMADSGMVIGSHGRAHVRWTELSDSALEAETTYARLALEDLLGVEVTEAACPFGAIDARVHRQLQQAGFRQIHTTYIATTRLDGPLIDRFSVTNSFAVERDLAPRLNIPARCLDVMRRHRRWRALNSSVAPSPQKIASASSRQRIA